MAIISIPYTFSPGGTIVSSQVNSCFSVIYSDYNGNIGNSNLSSSIVISDSKLAQITDASKVSGTALTGLASIPSGAGIIPTANIGPLLSTANILNYGTNTSASTTVSPANLKIAYGLLSMVPTTGTTVSNLPFTSSSSYTVIVSPETTGSSGTTVSVNIASASTFLVYSNTSTVNTTWMAIGY